MRPQPQMVGKWGLSDDKLTYTFELRDGLKFSDGSAVTADDVVASIRRWAARDGAGQHMMPRVKDLSKKDDKTFAIALKEPYGLVLDVDGQDLDAAALHHAQEGSRDRPEPAGHRIHRLRPLHLQP